jgi:hypothetical protein
MIALASLSGIGRTIAVLISASPSVSIWGRA